MINGFAAKVFSFCLAALIFLAQMSIAVAVEAPPTPYEEQKTTEEIPLPEHSAGQITEKPVVEYAFTEHVGVEAGDTTRLQVKLKNDVSARVNATGIFFRKNPFFLPIPVFRSVKLSPTSNGIYSGTLAIPKQASSGIYFIRVSAENEYGQTIHYTHANIVSPKDPVIATFTRFDTGEVRDYESFPYLFYGGDVETINNLFEGNAGKTEKDAFVKDLEYAFYAMAEESEKYLVVIDQESSGLQFEKIIYGNDDTEVIAGPSYIGTKADLGVRYKTIGGKLNPESIVAIFTAEGNVQKVSNALNLDPEKKREMVLKIVTVANGASASMVSEKLLSYKEPVYLPIPERSASVESGYRAALQKAVDDGVLRKASAGPVSVEVQFCRFVRCGVGGVKLRHGLDSVYTVSDDYIAKFDGRIFRADNGRGDGLKTFLTDGEFKRSNGGIVNKYYAWVSKDPESVVQGYFKGEYFIAGKPKAGAEMVSPFANTQEYVHNTKLSNGKVVAITSSYQNTHIDMRANWALDDVEFIAVKENLYNDLKSQYGSSPHWQNFESKVVVIPKNLKTIEAQQGFVRDLLKKKTGTSSYPTDLFNYWNKNVHATTKIPVETNMEKPPVVKETTLEAVEKDRKLKKYGAAVASVAEEKGVSSSKVKVYEVKGGLSKSSGGVAGGIGTAVLIGIVAEVTLSSGEHAAYMAINPEATEEDFHRWKNSPGILIAHNAGVVVTSASAPLALTVGKEMITKGATVGQAFAAATTTTTAASAGVVAADVAMGVVGATGGALLTLVFISPAAGGGQSQTFCEDMSGNLGNACFIISSSEAIDEQTTIYTYMRADGSYCSAKRKKVEKGGWFWGHMEYEDDIKCVNLNILPGVLP